MKKFLSLFIALALIITLAGPAQTASAATIKISKSSLLLYVGDTANLKLTGTTKTVKWSSNNGSVATISSKGKVTAKGIGKTIVIGKIGSKSYSCKVEVRSNNASDKLNEINNFVVDNIWNNGYCNISWYISSGTDSTGEKLDINKTLKDLTASMTQLSVYDKYITGLKGGQYDSLKTAWKDLYNESQSLYGIVKSSTPIPNDENSSFSSNTFTDYMNTFSEECSYFN